MSCMSVSMRTHNEKFLYGEDKRKKTQRIYVHSYIYIVYTALYRRGERQIEVYTYVKGLVSQEYFPPFRTVCRLYSVMGNI